MKTWQLVVSLAILGLAIWSIFGLLPKWVGSSETAPQGVVTPAINLCRANPDTSPDPSQNAMAVNQAAQISSDGSPLPSTVQEDVEIKLVTTEFSQDISGSSLLYDHDSGNWETQFVAEQTEIRLCFIGDQIFIDNLATWDEVDPQLLVDETDVRQYILSEEQLHDFNRQAVKLSDQDCGSHSCAVWRASPSDTTEIVIRVNKFSRKIEDVAILDGASLLMAQYSYQPIEVALPDQVRYLAPPDGDSD